MGEVDGIRDDRRPSSDTWILGDSVETICGQTSQCVLMSFFCFVSDFQTLLAGAVAIIVAIIAGHPVWRQLKDTKLQTRIPRRKRLRIQKQKTLCPPRDDYVFTK